MSKTLPSFLAALRRALDALITPLQNHQALLHASVDAIGHRILEMQRAISAIEESGDKFAQKLSACRAEETALSAAAREAGARGEREQAYSALLRRRVVRSTIETLESESVSALEMIPPLEEKMRHMRRAYEMLQERAAQFAAAESCDAIETGAESELPRLERVIERGLIDLDHLLLATKPASAQFEIAEDERAGLEEELRLLLSESGSPTNTTK